MVRTILVIFLLFGALPCSSQAKFETKIIIEDSLFYGVEIGNQEGKLYIGSIYEPIDSAEVYALPAGTKRRTLNFLPFSWDLQNDTIYCVNFTEHPENSRLTSFKSIPLKGLPEYDESKRDVQLRNAAQKNSTVINFPLVSTIKKYMYMDNLFFDVLVKDNIIYQFICVNDELTAWRYISDEWKQSEVFPFAAPAYFTSFIHQNQIYLVNFRGEKFLYDGELKQVSSLDIPLQEKTLINNRDAGTIDFVSKVIFDQTSLSIQEIIDKYGKH